MGSGNTPYKKAAPHFLMCVCVNYADIRLEINGEMVKSRLGVCESGDAEENTKFADWTLIYVYVMEKYFFSDFFFSPLPPHILLPLSVLKL